MTQEYDLNHYPLWTALVTPFDAEGNIDFARITELVAEQQAAGNGILLLGSTGEGLALETDEQKAIVDHVCALALSVPLMVAVGGFNLAQQKEWIAYCNTKPVHAYLLGSPLYAKPGKVGQLGWFSALLDVSAHPCMLYNVPGRSAVALDPSVLAELQSHPNCWALKEASGSIAAFEAFRAAAPEIAIYSGDDALMPYFAQAGAKGLVSVASNAWPEQTHEFVRRSLAGSHPNLFSVWSEAIQSLFSVANPVPVKVLMHRQGKLASPMLRPPLSHLELTDFSALDGANTRILSWN